MWQAVDLDAGSAELFGDQWVLLGRRDAAELPLGWMSRLPTKLLNVDVEGCALESVPRDDVSTVYFQLNRHCLSPVLSVGMQ